MGYLFLVIMACLSAYVASKKGRRPLLWFVLGLFFPLLGFLVVLVLPSMRAIPPGQWNQDETGTAPASPPNGWENLNPDSGANPQGGQWRNPQPGQNGSGYNPEWTRPSWASPQPEQDKPRQNQAFQVCPQCGATVDENARYCENCGHKLRFKFNLDKASDEALDSSRHCPSCNRLINKNAGWCPHCGYKLKSE